MLVLDGRYAVEDGAFPGLQPAHDLLLDRPVALLRLALPPAWRGERAARQLRLACCPRATDGLLDVGVEQDGLYVVLPVSWPDVVPPRPEHPARPVGGDSAGAPRAIEDQVCLPLRRTAVITSLWILVLLAGGLAADGLLG